MKPEQRARQIAEAHGCRLVPHGGVWRVRGPGVDILLADLGALSPSDFPDASGATGGLTRARWKATLGAR